MQYMNELETTINDLEFRVSTMGRANDCNRDNPAN
jgi:hypothetical protein